MQRQAESLLSTAGLATAHILLAELRNAPLTVKHEVTRNIPRPTMMTFVLEDGRGRRYVLPPLNLSYKFSAPVMFPVSAITGREEDNGLQATIMVELHYDK